MTHDSGSRSEPEGLPAHGDTPVMDTRDVPVLYIAGIGRSGSTLLCRTLGTVDGCLATGELMRIIGRGVETGDFCSCGRPVSECDLWGRVLAFLAQHCPDLDYARLESTRKWATESWGFLPYLFVKAKPEERARDLDEYRRFLTTLYRAIREVTGARVIVDASKNLMFARLLTETPGVRVGVLHLVRDSRGVAYSLMKKQPRPGTSQRSEHFRQFGATIGSVLWSTAHVTTERLRHRTASYVRLRYEDFVADPSAAVERVLGETFPGVLPERFAHVNCRSIDLGVDHLIASNPNRSRRGTIELHEDVDWRTHMSVWRRWLVTGLTFPLLRRYGYLGAPASDAVPARVGRVATREPGQ